MANGRCSRQKQGKKRRKRARGDGGRQERLPDRIKAPHSATPDPQSCWRGGGQGRGTGLGRLSVAAQGANDTPPTNQVITFLFLGCSLPLWKEKKNTLALFFFPLCTETSFIFDPNPLPLLLISTGKGYSASSSM